jgi:oligoendopeptidase F
VTAEHPGGRDQLPRRSDVPLAHRWRQENVFADRAEWEKAIEWCRASVGTLDSFKGTLGSGPARLVELLEFTDRLFPMADRAYLYARLCYEVETTNPDTNEMLEVASHLLASTHAAASFLQPELMEVGLGTVEEWIQQEPQLSHLENVVEASRTNASVWHRYFRLRRDALGYEDLHTYDLDVPLPGAEVDIPYQEAVEMVCAALRPLGTEYVETLRAGVEEDGWVDVYPNVGKHAGAQVICVYGAPPYVLLNYSNDLTTVSHLAHELGHAMHSLLTYKQQPYVYSGQATYVAETASNVNQALLRHYLLEISRDRALKLAVIEEALSGFRRYLLKMPILAATELWARQQVERGEPIGPASHRLDERATSGSVRRRSCARPRSRWNRLGDEHSADHGRVLRLPVRDWNRCGVRAARRHSHLRGRSRAIPADARCRHLWLRPDLVGAAGADLMTPATLQRAYTYVSQLIDEFKALLEEQ